METEEFLMQCRRYASKRVAFILVCLAVTVVAVLLNVAIGKYYISITDAYEIIINHIRGIPPDSIVEFREDYIVWEQRLPRSIVAFCVGMTLGVCGAAMQSSLKNPLADPYTTGISSGASLGVCMAIIMGISVVPFANHDIQIIVNAFLFSLIPAGIIIVITKLKRTTPTTMILTGVAVMYLFSATTSFMMLVADESDLAEVYRWGLGSLGSVGWNEISYVIIAALVSLTVIWSIWKKLNLLAMDDESAISLGVNPYKLRSRLLVVVSLCTAIVVCFTGTIGFVGLVAPHMVRIFFGSNNKYLIPASAVFGGVFLLLADTVAKVAGATDQPVGLITSLVGGPLFLYILLRQRKSQWR